MRRPLALASVALGLLLLATGCLPKDTRPPPAEVTVTVSASEFTQTSIPAAATADGYAIFIVRLLVNLGQEEVGGDMDSSCNEYSSPDYTRLFDFNQVRGPTELGIAYATGHCGFGFAVRFPNLESKLGIGVNEDDRTFMRTPGTDHVAKDDGVSVYIEGVAQRGDEIKHFTWPIRRRIGYRDCGTPTDDGSLKTGIDLVSNGKATINLEIQGEALFRGSALNAQPLFEPYAMADADGDGDITFDELWTVPIETVQAAGLIEPPAPVMPPSDGPPSGQCFNDDGDAVVVKTLGDYVYCTLLKDVVRFEGNGTCTTVLGRSPERN